MTTFASRLLVIGGAVLLLAIAGFAQRPGDTSSNHAAVSPASAGSFANVRYDPNASPKQNGLVGGMLGLRQEFPRTTARLQPFARPRPIGTLFHFDARGTLFAKPQLMATGLFSAQTQSPVPLTASNDTWLGGSGNWSNASLWSLGVVPNGNYNALIDSGVVSPVALDVSAGIENLTIDSNDSLSFNPGTQLTINGGTISNAGEIIINGGGGSNTYLLLGANTTLSGGGTVTLSTVSGGGSAIIQGSGFTLTNSNNTIEGSGIIGNGSLALVNQSGGVIDANSSGQALLLNGSGGITNSGLLEATNSGILNVDGGVVNNAGGNITANGGTVQLYGGTDIQGGTLNSLNSGTLGTPGGNTATLDGSTANGAVTLSTGSTYTTGLGAQTTLLGTINNKGTFLVNGGNGSNSYLLLGANTTLQGGGTVTLSTNPSNGGNAIIQGSGLTLTNTNNLIQGAGIIGNGSLTFVNESTVDANVSSQALLLNGSGGITNSGLLEATNSGILNVGGVVVNNAGGNITANGGTVQLYDGTDIQGGTLNSSNGGTLGTPASNIATLDGSTHGVLTLSKGSTYTTGLGAQTTLLGTINNNGNFLVNGGSGNNTYLLLGANTTLQGKGTVTLSTASGGGSAIIQGSGFTLTNTSNTIEGSGIIGNGSLTLVNSAGGTLFANVSGATLLINGSGKITNKGTMEVASGSTMHITNGSFTNFAGTTLTGGTYNISGTLEIDELGSTGGEIVTNAAKIILNGKSSNFIDSAGLNALSNLTTNAAAGGFTLSGGQNFTTNSSDAAHGNFTNSGSLTVNSGSTFNVTGSLTNFSGTTLKGGTYVVGGTFEFPGANIVTNSAKLTLAGSAAKILNSVTSADGLANFATNAAGASFSLLSGATFTTAGNFTNSGTFKVGTGSTFTVGGPGLFTQTAGTTTSDGTLTDSGGLQLTSGSLFGKGTVNGSITSTGVVTPGDSATLTGILTDNGPYAQGSTGVLNISIGGLTSTKFDQLNSTNSTLNGTLNVTLIKGFVPAVGNTFKIMNFTSASGAFSTVNGLAINSTEHFTIAYQGPDVLLTVASGAAPAGETRRFLPALGFSRPTRQFYAGAVPPVQEPQASLPRTYGLRNHTVQLGFSLPVAHLFSTPHPLFGID